MTTPSGHEYDLRAALEQEHARAGAEADVLTRLALTAACSGSRASQWIEGFDRGREAAYTAVAKRALARKIEIAAELAVLQK